MSPPVSSHSKRSFIILQTRGLVKMFFQLSRKKKLMQTYPFNSVKYHFTPQTIKKTNNKKYNIQLLPFSDNTMEIIHFMVYNITVL